MSAYGNVIVCIDNGHGVDTPGKRSPYSGYGTVPSDATNPPQDYEYKEGVMMRKIAKRLGSALQKEGFQVYYVTPENDDISINSRVIRIYNKADANKDKKIISISLHSNAATNKEWTKNDNWMCIVGDPNTYENKTMLLGEYRLSDCLTNAAKDLNLGISYKKTQMDGKSYYAVPKSGIGMVAMSTVKNHKNIVATVLTENLFHTNGKNVLFLKSEKGINTIVKLHVNGIKSFCSKYLSGTESNTPAQESTPPSDTLSHSSGETPAQQQNEQSSAVEIESQQNTLEPIPEWMLTPYDDSDVIYIRNYTRTGTLSKKELTKMASEGNVRYTITDHEHGTQFYEFKEEQYKNGKWGISAFGYIKCPPDFICSDPLNKIWTESVKKYTEEYETPVTANEIEAEKPQEASVPDVSVNGITIEDVKETIESPTESLNSIANDAKMKMEEAAREAADKIGETKEIIKETKEKITDLADKAESSVENLKEQAKSICSKENESVKLLHEILESDDEEEEEEAADPESTEVTIDATSIDSGSTSEKKSKLEMLMANMPGSAQKAIKAYMQIIALKDIKETVKESDNIDPDSAKKKIKRLKKISKFDLSIGDFDFNAFLSIIIGLLSGLVAALVFSKAADKKEQNANETAYNETKEKRIENLVGNNNLIVNTLSKERQSGFSTTKIHSEIERQSKEEIEETAENSRKILEAGIPEIPASKCDCMISMCDDRVPDVTKSAEDSPLADGTGIVIEFDNEDTHSISATVGGKIARGTEIGMVGGYHVTSNKSFTVTGIGDNYICGTLDDEEIPETDSIDIETMSSDMEDICERMNKYAQACSFIKDNLLYCRIPSIPLANEFITGTDDKSSDWLIRKMNSKAKEATKQFNREMKRLTKNRTVKTYSRDNRLPYLKVLIDEVKERNMEDIIEIYDTFIQEGYRCTGSDDDFKIYDKYEKLMEEDFVYDDSNEYSKRMFDAINSIMAVREAVEMNANPSESEMAEFEISCTPIKAVSGIDGSVYDAINSLIDDASESSVYSQCESILKEMLEYSSEEPQSGYTEDSDYNGLISSMQEDEEDSDNEDEEDEETEDALLKYIRSTAVKFAALRKKESVRETMSPGSLREITEDESSILNEIARDAIYEYRKEKDLIESGKIFNVLKSTKWTEKGAVYFNNEKSEYWLVESPDKDPNINLSDSGLPEDMTTEGNVNSMLYWLRWLSIATLMNCALPMYWATGIVTPAGPQKLPIIMLPVFATPMGKMILVIGVGICGICPLPLIIFGNASDIDLSVLAPLNMIVDLIKNKIKNKGKVSVDEIIEKLVGNVEEIDEQNKKYEEEIREIDEQITQLRNAKTDAGMEKRLKREYRKRKMTE